MWFFFFLNRFLHKIPRKLSQHTYQSLTGGLVYHRNRQRCAGLRVIQRELYVLLREDRQSDRTFNAVWRCKPTFSEEKSKSRYGKNKYTRLVFFFFLILLRSQGDWQGLSSLDGFGALGYYLSVEGNNNLSFGKSFRTLLIETKCHSCEDKDSNLTVLSWLFLCRLKNMLIISPAQTFEIC